jgi:D-3-phosphoglycerate dehydrogenase
MRSGHGHDVICFGLRFRFAHTQHAHIFPCTIFVSLNIPYIKGSPEEGGTHGILGTDIIRHFKPDAVLLNFARGELVDSAAMKEFLDAGSEGRYISDFPDDELWNHDNAIILPHLGASTEEAEDSAVRDI